MAIRLSAVDGIDMGNKSISNASQIDGSIINEDGTSVLVEGDVYTKAEIDSTVATTSAKGMVELATTTEARTGTDSTRAVTPQGLHYAFNKTGSAPMYACRAWVNFNGTGTVAIRASGNVSSITDNGVGNYTVNFTTAMPDANYCVSGIAGGVSGGGGTKFWINQSNNTDSYAPTASSTRIGVGYADTVYIDCSRISVQIFR